jgi:hypothetical protein
VPVLRREGAIMEERDAIARYNYATFESTDDFLAFRAALPVGSAAPDFPVIVAGSGEAARLSDIWQDRDLLIEIGSLT